VITIFHVNSFLVGAFPGFVFADWGYRLRFLCRSCYELPPPRRLTTSHFRFRYLNSPSCFSLYELFLEILLVHQLLPFTLSESFSPLSNRADLILSLCLSHYLLAPDQTASRRVDSFGPGKLSFSACGHAPRLIFAPCTSFIGYLQHPARRADCPPYVVSVEPVFR